MNAVNIAQLAPSVQAFNVRYIESINLTIQACHKATTLYILRPRKYLFISFLSPSAYFSLARRSASRFAGWLACLLAWLTGWWLCMANYSR